MLFFLFFLSLFKRRGGTWEARQNRMRHPQSHARPEPFQAQLSPQFLPAAVMSKIIFLALLCVSLTSVSAQSVQNVKIPRPPPTSFPDVRCLTITPFVRTVKCVCHLVVSGKVKTNRNETSKDRCLAQRTKAQILKFDSSCNYYRTHGKIDVGKLLTDIRRIIRFCVDPKAKPLRFVSSNGGSSNGGY